MALSDGNYPSLSGLGEPLPLCLLLSQLDLGIAAVVTHSHYQEMSS